MHTRKAILFILISFLFSFKGIELHRQSFIEKVYTQTDRSLYFPEDTIWFKSYITNAEGKISTISEVMHAQLISPKGIVVKDIKLSITQGYAYGDFEIEEDWVGGIYKIRMFTNWMRNFGKSSFFEKELVVQKVISPNLLMTLEFDKESYGSNSEVIAHFEVKDLKNEPLSNKEIQFDVHIKGKKIKSETVTIGVNGKYDITFNLPHNLKSTDVLLNVLVPHKSSKESISRSVPVTLNNVDLQFFPESGRAIIGIDNQIAFKAVNEFGKPTDISGDIVDTKGQLIKTFRSFHDGMGSFTFTPNSEQYYAKITEPFKSDSLIPLPKAHIKGASFSIIDKNNSYYINIHSNEKTALTLSVSNAYKELVTKQLYVSNNEASFQLSKEDLSKGIIKVSLQSEKGNVLAERLLFANKSNQLKVNVSLDKKTYNTREKVIVKIKTTDAFDNPVPSNLSVSVADNKLVSFANDKQDNIQSYLLMSSELRGKIYKPSFYFDPDEDKAEKALDYVMLTHGWRRYINDTITFENARFRPDLKAIQYGKVVDKNSKGIKSHLLLFNQDSDKVLKFDTNEKGAFSFKVDKISNMVLVAYTDDGKKLNIIREKFVKATVQNDKQQSNDKKSIIGFKRNDIKKPLNKTIKEAVKQMGAVAITLDEDSAQLDEIVVVGYGIQKKRALSGAVVTVVEDNSISKINVDNIGQLLQGRISGVQVVNASGLYGSRSNISIRGSSSITGNSQPLFVIDGVPYNQNDLGGGALQNIDPLNINNIHVLKGAAASSLYGSNGVNGVVIITTKNQAFNRLYGSKSLNNKKFKNYAVQTFHNYGLNTYNSKQFYIPIYESETFLNDRNDFRETIYWNPVIQTDENGEASFEYYNSDAITSFIITTEGIGYNGLIGKNETKYATKKILNIDFKAPSYMVLNDTISLPITISNESNRLITAKLNIELPDELKPLEPFKELSINIKPNSYEVKNIKITPIKKTKETTIKISAIGDDYNDKIDKNVTIISPYFPTQTSISGHKDGTYQFDINNVVDGSLKAEFSIYTDIVGNVMDGIESLIREPYGCFEQVSSSTYPNVLILKYLKEANKSNPEIEKKALSFIKKGYRKLAAYETSEGGFEWYGHTPPHEALSAYGLMEFMEMKDVYDGVSDQMIQRTVNYLISRKNGVGGFKQNRGKYGFSAAPENVNNAYIIYALSESKIKVDVEKEYNAAFNEALTSNDSYRMALMACASFNLNKLENAHLLISKIKENINLYGFNKLSVENTITRSYGNAKEIETTAFSIFALLKQGESEYLVSQGIESILSKRKYGRFGSTQATSMALKALIEYTKTQKQKIVNDSSIEIIINGHSLKEKLTVNSTGKIVIENIENYIKPGKQNVTISFSNPEITFPYMLNVEWDSTLPNISPECKLELKTNISDPIYQVGETIRMNINVINKTNKPLPMTTAIIGIPSGTSAQPWQLKEILKQHKADYFEIFDNYLVFYWKEFNSSESKEIKLDLKAEVSGSYHAPASTVYLYYADEFKHWLRGNKVVIE